jgi:aryl-alcohol dehydrogenase-like predicted oxidoreductase
MYGRPVTGSKPDPGAISVRSTSTMLPRSGLTLSRVGLGFAHAHLLDPATRIAVIHRALDLGITHFDTARLYGDGLSEHTLGTALSTQRSSVTITTKFGLLPTPVIGSIGKAAMPFRKARSLMSKLGLVPYPKRSYTAKTMRKSLEASLRALRTDYIDIYHVHEPLPDTDLSDDLIAELQRAKTVGSIRSIGVSGDEIDSVITRYRGIIDVIQSAESSWDAGRWVPDITHSLFSQAARQAPGKLSADLVRTMLDSALKRRPQGAVIVQTRSPQHLTQIVEFAAQRSL